MKKFLILIALSFSPLLFAEYVQLGTLNDAIGIGTIAHGEIIDGKEVITKVVESDECVIRDVLGDDGNQEITFDYLGFEEVYPYNFNMSSKILRKTIDKDLTTFHKLFPAGSEHIWEKAYQKKVCHENVEMSYAGIDLTVEKENSVTVRWQATCLYEKVTTIKFYQFSCSL